MSKVVATTSMSLDGLSIGFGDLGATSALIGARIYNASGGAPIASANATIFNNGFVTIPISATLSPGSTYRLGFYVETAPVDFGSGSFVIRNGASITPLDGGGFNFVFPSYDAEPTGHLQVVKAWAYPGDGFPTNPNLAIPKITLNVHLIP